MGEFTPTAEQEAIIDACASGVGVKVEALAGTGKTTTLRLAAEAMAGKKGLYMAFNKAIQTEAKATFPKTVEARTAHSLAYGPVGRLYRDRMNGPRVTSKQMAAYFGIEGFGTGLITGDLSPAVVASLTSGTVRRFCQSADAEIGIDHVPWVEGLPRKSNAELRKHLLPYAQDVWDELRNPNGGRARFEHDHYLKIWCLTEPELKYDFIMFDECQPTGTVVWGLDEGHGDFEGRIVERKIEDLQVGDRLVAYAATGRLRAGGATVAGISKRPFDSDLITVDTPNGLRSRYTPNHRCIAVTGPAFEGKYLLYLMRRGDSWRLGTTGTRTVGRSRTSGKGRNHNPITTRRFEERADAIWLLAAYDSKSEALLDEDATSARFGIPQTRFVGGGGRLASQEQLDRFWSDFGDLTPQAQRCLEAFGRDIRYPFSERGGKRTVLHTRAVEIRAANLMDGMLVMDANAMAKHTGQWNSAPDTWQPITVGHEAYVGDVWSMTVDPDRTYVGDGIVTHNCQDANPVLTALVQAQSAQLIGVGDSNQQIYSWRGAKNALKDWPAKAHLALTESWRFGPAVAAEANKWLSIPELECDLRVRGRGPDSVVGPVEAPKAILCRTNAGAIREAMDAIGRPGERVAVVGGGKAIRDMAFAAIDLQGAKRTSHPELAPFSTWHEVQEFVNTEDGAEDLAVFVRLVDEHGPARLIDAVGQLVDEEQGKPTLTISTAHKAKGRQWSSVRIGDDFREPGLDEYGQLQRYPSDEAMLCYVAITRAMAKLDQASLAWIDYYLAGQPSPEQAARWEAKRRKGDKLVSDEFDRQMVPVMQQFTEEEREYRGGN